MGMKTIPQATVIALTIEERKALEALAGSRKSEARIAIGPGSFCWRHPFGLPRGCAGSRLHAGHRVEVAGALCQSSNGRAQ